MPVLLIAGLASLVIGLILFFCWFGYIIAIAKALIPPFLLAGGALAAYFAWEEMNDKKETQGNNTHSNTVIEANKEAESKEAESTEAESTEAEKIETKEEENN